MIVSLSSLIYYSLFAIVPKNSFIFISHSINVSCFSFIWFPCFLIISSISAIYFLSISFSVSSFPNLAYPVQFFVMPSVTSYSTLSCFLLSSMFPAIFWRIFNISVFYSFDKFVPLPTTDSIAVYPLTVYCWIVFSSSKLLLFFCLDSKSTSE